ncbi:hypothetical protein WISP_59859 [Willisornis vidua]|uniref:Uncharacterized protein n=1 Tax=Willisornis vidua TaxID=1566151 RepID=A0ABQ9DBI5_9PASS|nr:hypothetical protein WISP_59859 [Willisornis vidua]
MRRVVLLDVELTNKEEIIGDMKFGVSLGCSGHEMAEFRILCGGTRAIIRTAALEFKRAISDLFKDLLGGILFVRTLEEIKHREQETFMDEQGAASKTQMSKEVYGMWKKGQATWEECRDIARVCLDVKRKTKVHLESNLARDVKDNQSGFF